MSPLLLVAGVLATASSEPVGPRLVVMHIEAKQGLSNAAAELVTASLTTKIRGVGKFTKVISA